jgi:hypothetical protein
MPRKGKKKSTSTSSWILRRTKRAIKRPSYQRRYLEDLTAGPRSRIRYRPCKYIPAVHKGGRGGLYYNTPGGGRRYLGKNRAGVNYMKKVNYCVTNNRDMATEAPRQRIAQRPGREKRRRRRRRERQGK